MEPILDDVPSSAKKLKRSEIEEEDRKRIEVRDFFFFFFFFFLRFFSCVLCESRKNAWLKSASSV
jgi:hypothetical protein